MDFKKVLNESYPRYSISYKSTRPGYELSDKQPLILALDQSYNPDGKGESILGINLNYYKGNVEELIKKINKFDNENGFRGFEGLVKIKRFLKHDDVQIWEADKRNKRYKDLIKAFPELTKFIRRYKKSGDKGTGIQSQKRRIG